MSFIAQDFESKSILAILDGRTHAVIRNHFQRYQREVRELVEVITMDMYSPYYRLAKQLFPKAKIVLDRLHCPTSEPSYEPSTNPNHEPI